MKVAESLKIKGLAVPSLSSVTDGCKKQSQCSITSENVSSYQRFSSHPPLLHPKAQSLGKSGHDIPKHHPTAFRQNPGQVDCSSEKVSEQKHLNNPRKEPLEIEKKGFVLGRIDPSRDQSLFEQKDDEKPCSTGLNVQHEKIKEENEPIPTSHSMPNSVETDCEMTNGIKEEVPDTVESYSSDLVTDMEDTCFKDDEEDTKELIIAEDFESWNSQQQADCLQEFDKSDEHLNVQSSEPPSQDGCESQLRRELLRPVHTKTSPICLPWHRVQPNVPLTVPLKSQQPPILRHHQLPIVRLPQHLSSLGPPQQPSSLRPLQQPPPLRPPQHPSPLRLLHQPLREPPPLMKISSKMPVQGGDMADRSSQPMAIRESRDRGLHSTHLLVEAPPTYQSCTVIRQLPGFQVYNPSVRPVAEENMQPVAMSSRSSEVLEHMNASESPLNLSGQRNSPEQSEEVNRDHLLEKVSVRRRRHRGPKSWEFLVRLIKDPSTNPTLIRWEDEESGTFRLVRPAIIAQQWGRRASKHANECLSYENFARGLRYHYATGALHPVSERNLVYKFGKKALALLRKYSSVSEPVPAPLTSIESGS
ncbi:uncharacterized protein [Macrobrachium rosenbergii]|uniref:uncharacterized protein isoform X2 n=1 Tax=Macrobrachium rosenbergii TaxID=79674 RepID=UPI0034D48756